MTLSVEVVPDARWAIRAADLFEERLTRCPAMRICLPTGHTPRPLYREIASRSLDLSRLHVFQLDEFVGLPPGHPARCDTMLRTDLLDLLQHPPRAVHRPEVGEADLEVMCGAYEEDIRDGGLDLTWLGLGKNGHVGLNEPGSTRDAPTRPVRLSRTTADAAHTYGAHDQTLEWGVTIGMRTILASREIWLLVTGGAKGEILRRVVTGPVTPDVPASYLRHHPNALAIVDRAAARLIT